VSGDVRDPYPELARLRREEPIQRIDMSAMPGQAGLPVFIVYRYEDAQQMLRDNITFSSSGVIAAFGPVLGERVMLGMDEPVHGRLRGLVSKAFSQKALAQLQDELVARVGNELIDKIAVNGSADLVKEFTFDYPNLDGVAFFGAAGVPKHKLVATGIYDRWGVTFSSKLTWTSAPGNSGLYCFDRPDPGACNIGGRFETYYFDAQDFFQLDLAAQKEWSVGGGFKLRVRGDVLNVTNQVNYTDFGNFIGVGGAVNTSFGQRTGLGITGPTRTLKLSMGLSW
jgi:hypothetical protein